MLFTTPGSSRLGYSECRSWYNPAKIYIPTGSEYQIMVWMVGEWRVLFCLVLITIAFSVTAGCVIPGVKIVLSEEVCEKMSGLDRDHCYQNVARAEGDSKICENIHNPGPWSKCLIYTGDCSQLSSQATGDGAYTRYDCYQYLAIEYGSVKICEEELRDFINQ